MSNQKRLDLALVEKKYVENRSKAQILINQGKVLVDGKVIEKPSFRIKEEAKISFSEADPLYVSRSALKLLSGLEYFKIDVRDQYALDVGASTGGFTQVLLEKGAKHVTAIDVGYNQMTQKLREDPRITLYEGINARYVTLDDIGGAKIDLIVCDVSFISLRLALPNILNFVEKGTLALLLVKPQFEIGFNQEQNKRKKFNKQGVVKDVASVQKVVHDLYNWLDFFPSWRAKEIVPSKIKGKEGNQEYLLLGQKIV